MSYRYLKTLFASLCVSTVVLLGAQTGFCDLVDEGKDLLLTHYDVYGADAKFAEALLPPNENDPRANFWRAATIIMTNPDLKNACIAAGFFNSDGSLKAINAEGESVTAYSTVDNQYIDNEDISTGYSEEGSDWLTQALEGSYSGDCRTHAAGSGANKAVWTFPITTAGTYTVRMFWGGAPGNATDARFTIYHADGSTVIIRNQRDSGWNSNNLGDFRFTPASGARIELSDQTSTGQVVADAAMLEYQGIVLESESPDAAFSSNWTAVAVPWARGGQYREIAAGTAGDTCTWTPEIPSAGRYHLYAYWAASESNAVDAAFEIWVNGSLVQTIPVNQQKDGFAETSLGLCDLQAGTVNSIVLRQNPSGKVTTDGITLLPVRAYPNVTQFQNIIVSVLTQVDQAIACLDKVTSDFQDFADVGAADSSGNPITTEFDYGDALIFKGMLSALKFQWNLLGAYDMNNIDAHKLGASYPGLLSVNGILGSYPNLGALFGQSVTRMASAKQALIDSIEYYYDAYNFITVEMDSQEDDLITFDAGYQETAGFLHTQFDEILDNLKGTTPYFTVTTDDFAEAELSDSYYNMRVNLGLFFDGYHSLRGLMPQFDNSDNIVRSSAPDPDLGDVLPDVKQEDFNGMAKLGSRLYQPVVNWNGSSYSITLNWKQDAYSDFVSYKIYRSTSDTVDESSQKIYDSTSRTTTTVTDITIDPNQRIYYYKLYTYYSTNSEKAASLARRVISTIYVNLNATGDEDGSKEHPFSDLGDTIDDYGELGAKICVAQGTYQESDTSLHMWNCSGLYLEGGYDPSDWSRDITAHETIIDASGRGGWNAVSFSQMNGGVIDGFTVKGALMQEWACGINLWRSTNIRISNCKIQNSRVGIGIYEGSSVTIENCSVTGHAHEGVNVNGSSVTINQCSIRDNAGNGVALWTGNTFDIRDSDISNNVQRGIGGDYSRGTVLNTLITGNGYDGISLGGDNNFGAVTVENCTISGNCSGNMYSAGFICYLTDTGTFTPQVKNCIIANNSGFGVYVYDGSLPVISYTDVYNNSTGNYAGSAYTNGGGNISADPLFVSGPDGTYYLSQIAAGQAVNSPCVDAGSGSAGDIGTTKTTGEADSGSVDMGYHYAIPEIDTQFPVVSVYADPASPIVSQPIDLVVSASDNQLLKKVKLFWNAGEDSETWDNLTFNTFEITHNISSYANPGQVVEFWVEAWDQSGNHTVGTHQTITIQAPGDIIMDNTDSSCVFTGTWAVSSGVSGYYGTNYQYHSKGTGTNKATWSPNIAATGSYEVFARWTTSSNRASNAKYTITHAGGSSVFVADQRVNNGVWVSLGTFTFNGGTSGNVCLTDNADNVVVADAVKFVYKGPGDIIVDNTDSSCVFTGAWSVSSGVSGYYGTNYQYHSKGTGTNKATWSPNIAATGSYEVFARWTTSSNRASNAKYTITHAGGSSVFVADQRVNNGVWVSLGVFTFNGGASGNVCLTDNADNVVVADAIKFVYKGPGDIIVDNTDSDCVFTGAWSVSSGVSGYYGTNYQYHSKGTGTNKATWSPNIAATGSYEVFARWTTSSNRASNAKYTITHAGGSSVFVADQRINNGVWVSLGVFTFNGGTGGNVCLTDNADNVVVADAIKFVYKGPGDIIVDNTDSGCVFTGAWAVSSGVSGYYGTNYQYHSKGTGTNKATWSPNIAATGSYEVFARWTTSSNRASNAKYTITHAGGSSVFVADQRINNGVWVSLGVFTFNGGTGGNVCLTDNADNVVVADAIKFVYKGPGDIIVDNTDSGCVFTGAWAVSSGVSGYYGTNYQYHSKGTGTNKATWSPNIAATGSYEVFARWTTSSNRASNAKYTITHAGGSSVFVADQRVNNGVWVSLGVFTFNGGTSGNVCLTDNADNVVVADAIKFVCY